MKKSSSGVRKVPNRIMVAGIAVSSALVLARPDHLAKVYAISNQYNWVKLEDVDLKGGYYSSAASSADGTKLVLSVANGGVETDDESPLYVSSNSGATWQNLAESIDTGIQNEWTSVDMSDDGQTIVVASDFGNVIEGDGADHDGKVFITTDGGTNWNDISPEDATDWVRVVVSGDGTHIAGVESGGNGHVYITTNHGDSWQNILPNDGVDDLWNAKSISISDDGTKILVGGENNEDPYTKLFISDDTGSTWDNVSPDEIDNVYSNNFDITGDGTKITAATIGWTESQNDHVFRSSNDGAAWQGITPDETNHHDWVASKLSEDGTKYAALDEAGSLHITTNSASTWHEEDPGLATEDSNSWDNMDASEDLSRMIVFSDTNAYVGSSTASEAPTVSLDDAEGGKTITLTTPSGTTITCHTAVKESALTTQDGAYTYPLGLVDFCFSGADTANSVNLVFVTDLKPSQVAVRKYNPTTKTYANITGASITETTYSGKHALQVTYSITDNGPLDTDADSGEIADPVGLAVANVSVPNSGFGGTQNKSQTNPLATLMAITTVLPLLLVRQFHRKK